MAKDRIGHFKAGGINELEQLHPTAFYCGKGQHQAEQETGDQDHRNDFFAADGSDINGFRRFRAPYNVEGKPAPKAGILLLRPLVSFKSNQAHAEQDEEKDEKGNNANGYFGNDGRDE